ncbi:hypothetical protein BKA58DRAFT_325194 [Alternaria rosae]|uniref:uncharacterized protein n=1 Tax=Alternaria rosae TaxID=1187941 RepID=UPI001E8D4BDD|nr:uncharacterized protein BKA58DRAFT_325194 [Alternaria rosae]KAH6857402.1 hypothetical protein BKA58DRAFT_325194 [Alternaria rosae]
MSYEQEPAGAIWVSVTPSSVAPASFSALPASLSRLAGCHPSPSSAARGVTAICSPCALARIPPKSLLQPGEPLASSLVLILHGHCAGGRLQTSLTTSAVTSSCRTLLACPPESYLSSSHLHSALYITRTPTNSLQINTLSNLVTGFDPITLALSTARQIYRPHIHSPSSIPPSRPSRIAHNKRTLPTTDPVP